MKTKRFLIMLCSVVTFFYIGNVYSINRYVARDGQNIPPFTTRATAANAIQDAIDAASEGDTILVASGVYSDGSRVTPGLTSSNRVVIDKDIIVKSESGPENTIIAGEGPTGPAAIRCVYISPGELHGFTLSNGYTRAAINGNDDSGGGILCETLTIVSNCIVTCNNAVQGGGVHGNGTILDSRITHNYAEYFGGGMSIDENGDVVRCFIAHNHSDMQAGGAYVDARHDTGDLFFKNTVVSNYAAEKGGGLYIRSSNLPEECFIGYNSSDDLGGGVYNYGGGLSRCIVWGNSASNAGGGAYAEAQGHYTNCLFAGNNTAEYGGGVFFAGGDCCNCTISSNTATTAGGGVYCEYAGTLFNSIVYGNSAGVEGDEWHSSTNQYTPYYFGYTCTSHTNGLFFSVGCILEPPLFYDQGEDYHLMNGSPCEDAGFTIASMTSALDLDGNPRVQGNHIDMGCYETVPEPAMIGVILCVLGCIRQRQQPNNPTTQQPNNPTTYGKPNIPPDA